MPDIAQPRGVPRAEELRPTRNAAFQSPRAGTEQAGINRLQTGTALKIVHPPDMTVEKQDYGNNAHHRQRCVAPMRRPPLPLAEPERPGC